MARLTNPLEGVSPGVVRIVACGTQGTGIFVGQVGDDKFVVTANHVIEDCKSIQVVTTTGTYKATLKEQNQKLDLAVISVADPAFVAAPVAFARGIRTRQHRLEPIPAAYGFGELDTSLASRSVEATLDSGGSQGETFQLGGSGIPSGFSGGPLIQVFRGQPLCVGITCRGGAGAASSVYLHSREIIRQLRVWKVPLQTGTRWFVPFMVWSLAAASLILVLVALGTSQYKQLQESLAKDLLVCHDLESYNESNIRGAIELRYQNVQWLSQLQETLSQWDPVTANIKLRDRVTRKCDEKRENFKFLSIHPMHSILIHALSADR